MGEHRPLRLSSKVHQEVGVEAEAAIVAIHIHLYQLAALGGHAGVELLVPGADE
jgi:hypothetical protein